MRIRNISRYKVIPDFLSDNILIKRGSCPTNYERLQCHLYIDDTDYNIDGRALRRLLFDTTCLERSDSDPVGRIIRLNQLVTEVQPGLYRKMEEM